MKLNKVTRFMAAAACTVVIAGGLSGCGEKKEVVSADSPQTQPAEKWISLFNGKDLTGWKVKIKGHALGDNYLDTFQAKDGKLVATYENYQSFDNKFGHIFYQQPFSNYIVKFEYRFVGEQVNGGEGWAFRNNGIMLHSQSPESMALEQDFPRSVEVQLLGAYDDSQPRTTGNICTPATNVVINGKLVTDHCINSTGPALPVNEWVQAEVEVHGGEKIIHKINGEIVFEYEKPQYETNAAEAQGKSNLIIEQGYIALQAESHPTEFRNIQLKKL